MGQHQQMTPERKSATGYVSDDPATMQVIVAVGLKTGWMRKFECGDPDCETKIHYSWDIQRSDEHLNQAIKDGYFKLHLELGEFYYHPTVAGLELLECDCCKGERFTETELQTRGFDPCQG